jgi:hypothetical protein
MFISHQAEQRRAAAVRKMVKTPLENEGGQSAKI